MRIAAKEKYPSLNTRQISDAVTEAKGKHKRTKEQEPIVFGGKKLFAQVCAGQVSAEQWRFVRDGMMYSRGDRTKSGNPILRVVVEGDAYALRVTTGNRQFEKYSIFVPAKFRDNLNTLLLSGDAYNVRIRRKDETKYAVTIDYETLDTPTIFTRNNGVLGVDSNPTNIAICCVSTNGNRIWSKTLPNTRMFYGSKDKTNYEIALLIKEIVSLAVENHCAVSAENLRFKKDYIKGRRRWNRIKSNFVWKSFLELLERKCLENGVEFIKVNPAFTSVQGKLKYQGMFNVPVHEAAAYVIGRRALEFNERISVYQCRRKEVKKVVLQTMQEEGKDLNHRQYNWTLWRTLRDIPVLTGHLSRLRNPGELRGNDLSACGHAQVDRNCGGNPQRESQPKTGLTAYDGTEPSNDGTEPSNDGTEPSNQGEERHPSQPMRFGQVV